MMDLPTDLGSIVRSDPLSTVRVSDRSRPPSRCVPVRLDLSGMFIFNSGIFRYVADVRVEYVFPVFEGNMSKSRRTILNTEKGYLNIGAYDECVRGMK